MRGRTALEGALLSVGALCCIANALLWLATTPGRALAPAVSDPRFWSSTTVSLTLGLAVGMLLAICGTVAASAYLASGTRPPRLLLVVAVASALTPDLVHALAWRSALQPNFVFIPEIVRAAFAGNSNGQFGLVAFAIFIKWLPLTTLIAWAATPKKRIALYRTTLLAEGHSFFAFRMAFGPHLRRIALLLLCFGLILGFRQHEISEILFAGGAAFAVEGLSQWSIKVALSFLDPGRASVQVLAALLLAGAGLTFLAVLARARGLKFV